MKKPRTDQIEIAINSGRYVGPRRRLKLIRALLTELDFEPVTQQEENIPWREVAATEIAKAGEGSAALKGARARAGLSQSELAKKLGISQSNLSKMENGTRPIGKRMAARLAEVLKTDYRIFL